MINTSFINCDFDDGKYREPLHWVVLFIFGYVSPPLTHHSENAIISMN